MGESTTASNGRRTAVLLEEQPLWLEAVDTVLRRVGVETVGMATTPSDAFRLVREHEPDVFVTELDLAPGRAAGLACLRAVRAHVPAIKIIVVSAREDPSEIDEALGAGATAYVVKRAHPDDLASAIRQAFGHSIYLAGAFASVRETGGRELGDLTRREQEILRLAAEGLSNAAIAKTLWVTEQTVKFHLSNVYRKIDVTNRTEASRWAQLHGLLPPQVPQRALHVGVVA